MSINYNLENSCNTNKIFEYRKEHSFLSTYLSTIGKSVEHAFNVARQKPQEPSISLKTRDCLPIDKDTVDALFEDLGLEIFEDNHVGELPLHGITRSDYIQAKKILNDIASGKSNIKIDTTATPEFRQLVLTDILILLTRPTSRALFFELDKCCAGRVTITQGISPKYTYSDNGDENFIILPMKHYSAVTSQAPSGELFFAPFPRFIALAHELTHFLHDHTTGLLSDYPPTLGDEFDDLEEQYTITGDAGGMAPHSSICEQTVRREFNLPLRNSHGGVNFASDIEPWRISRKGITPLHEAAAAKAILNIKDFFDRGGTIDDIFNNKYLLFYSGDAKTANFFLEKGIPIDSIDSCRNTALNFAITTGKRDVAELLIRKGCRLDMPNSDGLLPLHLAVQAGDIKTLQLIQRYNAQHKGS